MPRRRPRPRNHRTRWRTIYRLRTAARSRGRRIRPIPRLERSRRRRARNLKSYAASLTHARAAQRRMSPSKATARWCTPPPSPI